MDIANPSFEQSKGLLIEVLSGSTCAEAGAARGLGRSAVNKRIKDLVHRLHQTVGIDGLDEEGLASLIRLRARRENVLAALERYNPDAKVTAPQDPMSPKQLQQAAAKVRSRSENPNRDVALLYLLFGTGAQPIEIARLKVADYLDPDGSVRHVSEVSERAAACGRARQLHWRSPRLIEAVDLYLMERGRRGMGTVSSQGYRGLDPDSALFLTEQGVPFEIGARQTRSRGQALCWGIHQLFRTILRRAGLHGVNTLGARQAVALRMRQLGAEDHQIGELLGLTDLRGLRIRLRGLRRPIEDLTADLV